ncbi:MAG: sarcosine oxidase subunit alpha family protein [Alphaproteobacteria bacterium]
MSTQPFRLGAGGEIDRSKKLRFTFDNEWYEGHPGDTLASALLANGVRLVARSFKYHRPRGVYSIGPEEPNAMIELRSGARREPNTRMTQVELYEGLDAYSQHAWPSLKLDIGAINQAVGRFIPAGFYYKTFMWPATFWETYEKFIRRAAGLGTASREPDPDHYDKMTAHCDVLVVGGGPAGLMAAKAAGKAGARVILVDERETFGGWLRFDNMTIEGAPAMDWVSKTVADLQAMPDVRLLSRATVFGYYDHNMLYAVERVQDHVAAPAEYMPRQRMWNIRARRVVLAAGAIEQPLAFGDNDRPGVMMAGAARGYANAYGVRAGKNAVILTNNDSAYRTAIDLADAGVDIRAVLDTRPNPEGSLPKQVRDLGISVKAGYGITAVKGRTDIWRAEVMKLGGSRTEAIDADLICVSGGWQPTLHLHSQTGAKNEYNEEFRCFVPGPAKQAAVSVGAANGSFALADCLLEGAAAGKEAAELAGRSTKSVTVPKTEKETFEPVGRHREIPDAPGRHRKRFVDIQDDVSVDDVQLAAREGYLSVEHLKRYTTLGMGTDQGKTSNLTGLAIMADIRGRSIPETGTTTFRPPYTPVAIGLFAGQETGDHYLPIRRTPMDAWHTENNVTWIDASMWRRPHFYPHGSENIDDACYRETTSTRGSVGMCDVTTLGKIDVQGPDAGEFLNRLYTNGFAKLPVGKARYGLMLREDGMVMDDGTTSRLTENHYHMTTTTANAGPMLARMEKYLQTVWTDLRVHVTSTTDQWAGYSIAGPNARKVLEKLIDIDISDEGVPFMGVVDCKLGGIPARLFRISFSGELAYEVNVPSDWALDAWKMTLDAGKEFSITAYGTECLGTMRIEKGHVAGSELNGMTNAADLGLEKMLSTKKEFIGKAMTEREGMVDPLRPSLVGLVPLDGKTWVKAGSHLVEHPDAPAPNRSLGYVTALAYSPELGTPVNLAMLSGGKAREGETMYAVYPLKNEKVQVKVTPTHFIDPKGERMHG